MRGVSRLVRNLLQRDRVERDLDDELGAAFDLLVSEKIRAGMSADEARRQATLELGRLDVLKEQVRDVRRGASLDTFLLDLRYAVRLLRRNPLFTMTAALSLAIGIGSTTTIFTVANGLLLRTATGVTDPGSLVDINRTNGQFGVNPVSLWDYRDIRDRATTLDGIYWYRLGINTVSVEAGGVGGGAELVYIVVVSKG